MNENRNALLGVAHQISMAQLLYALCSMSNAMPYLIQSEVAKWLSPRYSLAIFICFARWVRVVYVSVLKMFEWIRDDG